MTIFPSGVSYLTSYSQVNGSIGATNLLIFQASSASNVITYLSGYVIVSSSAISFCVGPTSGGDPNTTNGTLSAPTQLSSGKISYTYGGAGGVSYPGTSANNTIYDRQGLILETNAGAHNLIWLNSFIITPGYYVYMYGSGGTTAYGYELKKVEVRQS